MTRILIADDEPAVRQLLELVLAGQGYEVSLAPNGAQLVRMAQERVPDLMLVDLMMPQIDGYEAIRQLRNDTRTAHVPMLILTAKSTLEDVVIGFETGADDYITKPFSIEELLLKIDIFLRRSKYTGILRGNTPVNIGHYAFDYKNLSLTTEGYSETLTQKEADLLKLLNEHKNQVIKRSFILETIWGKDDYFLGRSLDVFISRLRKYLNLDERIKIENIHGVGFKFRVDD